MKKIITIFLYLFSYWAYSQDVNFEQVELQITPLNQTANFNIEDYKYNNSSFKDLDNDGDQDFLLSGYSKKNESGIVPMIIVIYLNDGKGTFKEHQRLDIKGEYFRLGYRPTDWGSRFKYLLQDVNGDSFLDIQLYQTVFENDGKGNFRNHPTKLPVHSTHSSHFVDIDNDQDLDLIDRNQKGEDWCFKNNGKNQYTDSILLPWSPNSPTSNHVFQDIDQDGDIDAFAQCGSHQIQLYLNDGNGNFSELPKTKIKWDKHTNYYFRDLDKDKNLDLITHKTFGERGKIKKLVVYKNDGQFAFTKSYEVNFNSSTPNFQLVDVNCDGLNDLFFSRKNWGDKQSNKAKSEIYINQGYCTFKKDTTSSLQRTYEYSFEYGGYGFPVFTDLNDDNCIDYFFPDRFSQLYINQGNGQFISKSMNIELNYCNPISTTDINNDKLPDILLRRINTSYSIKLSLVQNQGNLNFIKIPQSVDSTLQYGNLLIFDLDGDKLPDLVHRTSNGVRSYINKSEENFTEVKSGITDISSGIHNVSHSQMNYPLDVDNDGDLDLLVKTDFKSYYTLYKNDGVGNFTIDTLSEFKSLHLTENKVHFRDFNNDGFIDVLIQGYNELERDSLHHYPRHYIEVFYNDGKGVFNRTTDLPWESSFLVGSKIVTLSPLSVFTSVFQKNNKGTIKKLNQFYQEDSTGQIIKTGHLPTPQKEEEFKTYFLSSKNGKIHDAKSIQKSWKKHNKTQGFFYDRLNLNQFVKDEGYTELLCKDFDSDGDYDFLGLEVESNESSDSSTIFFVFYNNEQNKFDRKVLYKEQLLKYNLHLYLCNDIKFIDLNGDGTKDFYFRLTLNNQLLIFNNTGKNDIQTIPITIPNDNLDSSGIYYPETHWIDTDNDGDFDLILKNTKGKFILYKNKIF